MLSKSFKQMVLYSLLINAVVSITGIIAAHFIEIPCRIDDHLITCGVISFLIRIYQIERTSNVLKMTKQRKLLLALLQKTKIAIVS